MMRHIYSILRLALGFKPATGFALLLTAAFSVPSANPAARAAGFAAHTTDQAASVAGNWSVNTTNASCPGTNDGLVRASFFPAPASPAWRVNRYELLDAQGAVVSSTPTGQFSGLPAGTYQVRALVSAAVADTALYGQAVQVKVTETPVVPVVDHLRGNISLYVPADNGSFAYTWDHGATTRDVQGMAPGTYAVSIRTSTGCTLRHEVSILNPGGSGGTELPSAADLSLTEGGARVGIGLAAPQAALHINTTADQPAQRAIWVTGNGTGTSAADAAFAVYGNGFVYAREVQVKTVNPWPDYVFSPGHQRLTLDELEQYIGRHSHLPGIPAAAEVEREGQSLGEMQRLMLEKIEEQSLYILELHNRIRQLEERLSEND